LRPDIISSVPTLSEWGLIAMVAVFAVVGAFALRKHLAKPSAK